jgi:DNA-directed RNA polymerase specialized sigma24 family protein
MLVEQHASDVYRLVGAIVGSADAADVAQESFVAAWQQLPRLRGCAGLRGLAAADLREPIAQLAAVASTAAADHS